MPGDVHKKVQAGQRLNISAEAFNAFLEASGYVRARKHSVESGPIEEFRQTGIVKVRNATGIAQDRFNVLALGAPIVGPAQNLTEFKSKVNFNGLVPLDPITPGRFGVLLEPLAAGAIGRAVVGGVTIVRLKMDAGGVYDFAEMEHLNTQTLRNLPAGSARVLWVEDTGAQEGWAIVRLDGGDYQAHVLITSNVPDADGYYPGLVQRYNVDLDLWETQFPCKVMDINA